MTRQLFIKLRVTAEEKSRFESLSGRAGMSLSDLIRNRLAGLRIRPSALDRERNRHLARIGNNMNQLARWANSYKSGMEAIRVISALESIRREIKHFAMPEPEEAHDDH